MRAAIIAVLVWFAGTALAAAQTPIAIAPYKISSEGTITIDVTVNGRGPYPFIVDTGATLTIVFENLARGAALKKAEGVSLRVLSISGAQVFEPYEIGALAAGVVLSERQVGIVLPDWDAPRETPAGIIGLDILENFALAFDVRAKTIAFYGKAGLPKRLTERMRRVSIKRTRYDPIGAELFTVRGRVNGEPLDFIIDLGLATTLINYAAGDALTAGALAVATGRTATTGSRIEDVFDDRTRASAGVMRAISVGTKRWTRKIVWIYDAPLFDELDVQRLAYGLIGADLLTSQDFAIDFSEKKIYFARH
jgi:predicted aspartyl protease